MNDKIKPDHNGEHPWGDAGQLIILVVFLAVWVIDSFIAHYTTGPAHFLPLGIRLGAGGLLLILGLVSSGKGHRVLSNEIRQSGCLLKDGIFARVRHPLYLGSMLFYAGLTAMTASILSLAGLIPIFLFYNRIAAYEEGLLARRFAREYADYRKRVPRWRPLIRPAVFD
ncbi:MAG: isoprenylcysteine carboxylmethyltransferase family protein [Candidatus Aminicenantes bacterium]|nr:isoprenylcysteine carboxylmethyltransferase family protein [Candidatus Aminicenantes bacterium]